MLPNIEELSDKVKHVVNVDQDGDAFLEMYRLQTQALLLVCLELMQINNNLEALRRGDRS